MIRFSIRLLFLVLLTAVSGSLQAQSKAERNGMDALSKKQFERALSVSEKACKNPETSKFAWPWFIKANALYELGKDQDFVRKNPGWLKEAVKSALKAKGFDKSGKYTSQFSGLLRNLKDANNKEAWSNFGQEKYFRAIQSFRFGYDLAGDTLSYAMMGVSYLLAGESREALPVLREAVRRNVDAFRDSVLLHTMVREPFEHLARYYMSKNLSDSARFVVENGLDIFPKNTIIRNMQIDLLRQEVRSTPISQPQIVAINKALALRPNDSFFLYSQNAYYLFRIRNSANAGDLTEATRLLQTFAADKEALFQKGARNGADIFLLPSRAAILNLVWLYYGERSAFTTAALTYRQYLKLKCPACEDKPEALTKAALDSLPIGLVHAWTMIDPRTDAMKTFRLKYYQGIKRDSLGYPQMAPLVRLSEDLLKEFPKDVKIKAAHEPLLLRWMDMALKTPDMSAAWIAYRKLEAHSPASKSLDPALEKLVRADFANGYFGTRVTNYRWNGSTAMCLPGTLSDTLLDKVEERINFFRRNAGVLDPIILAPEKNRMCQQAVLAWEVTGTLSHEVDKFNRCYTEEANTAAKNSVPIAGVNTVLAVSSAMDDNENKSLGNRRWLLNPIAYALGHGSSKTFGAIWVVDDKGNKDSSRYKNRFIAWPNQGYVAKRLLFKYWSFSAYHDLKDATVTLTDAANQTIPVEVQPFDPLYPMPTIVWQPAIDAKNVTDKTTWQVRIRAKDGKTWTYKVTALDLNPQ